MIFFTDKKDNGRGFDTENPARQNPSGGNELRNMQTRAALLWGTFTLKSGMEQGTTTTLNVPV